MRQVRRRSPPRLLGIALLVSLPLTAALAEPPGITRALAALDSVHAITEVALSPDGKRLVYGRRLRGKRGGADVDIQALYIVNAGDGSGETRLTACPGALCDEHGAAWSPDGKQIVFVTTDESEQPQIALATDPGGNGRTLTRAHGPLDTPRFSPDGKGIAFLYSAGAPRTPGPLNPLARDAGVLSSIVYEQRLAVIPAAGGEPRLLGPLDLNIYEFDWSPDGGRFVVSAAHGSGDDNWWIAELDIVDAQSGAVTTLAKPRLQIASPRWSGDGRRIAWIGGIMSDETITGGDVFLIPAAGGEAVDVTPGLAASVHTITWNGSATHLTATEFAAGEEVLASIDVGAKSQRELWRAPGMIWASNVFGFTPGDSGISLSKNGAMSAVIRQSYTSPPEVASGPPGKWRPITRINAGVRPITGKATNIYWRSDSFKVQGMLIEPPAMAPGKSYPLVVLVHGGPAHAHYPLFPASPDAFDAVLASEGYFVFAPNPRGSYGQGEAFTQANVRDFGYGDLRDILAGVDAVLKSAPVDPARLGIAGWSYGGYMTMWALTQTDRFKAAVAGAGLSDWLSYYGTNNIDTWMIPYFGASVYVDPQVYERSSPIAFIRRVRTPTLMVGGDRDAEVPITQSYEYWNALRRLGVKTEFVVYPDEGHFFFKHDDQVDVMTRLVGWFDEYLKPRGYLKRSVSNARLTDLESLQAYLTARIPPARALGIRVEAMDPVTLAAALAANLNDKGTGFAGSLYSVAALAGWALLMRWCATESLDAEVVLQSSSAQFLAPARSDFRAIVHEFPGAQREKLRRMLARSGRGRAEVAVDVKCHEALVMSFTGAYAVIAGGRAK